MGRSDGVFGKDECQGLRTDHLIVDKTGLRVLWGVVVVCGELLVVVGLLRFAWWILLGVGSWKRDFLTAKRGQNVVDRVVLVDISPVVSAELLE